MAVSGAASGQQAAAAAAAAVAEYMKSKPPNSESKILYLRPFKAYNMLIIF